MMVIFVLLDLIGPNFYRGLLKWVNNVYVNKIKLKDYDS